MKLSSKDIFKISNRDIFSAKKMSNLELAQTSTDPNVLSQLRRIGNDEVLIALTKNPKCDNSTKERLLYSGNSEVVKSAVQNMNLSEIFNNDLFAIMRLAREQRNSGIVYSNINDPELLERLYKSNNLGRSEDEAISINPNLSMKTIGEMLHSDGSESEEVKSNPKLIKYKNEVLNKKNFQKMNPEEKNLAALILDDPNDILELAKLKLNKTILTSLSKNIKTPSSVLEIIAQKFSDTKMIYNLVRNSNSDEKVLSILIEKLKQMEKLDTTATRNIVNSISQNENVTPQNLTDLLSMYKNMGSDVVNNIIRSDKFPIQILENNFDGLLQNRYFGLEVAKKQNLSTEIIHKLLELNKNSFDIKYYLVVNPNISENDLITLALDDHSDISEMAEQNPKYNSIKNNIELFLENLTTTKDLKEIKHLLSTGNRKFMRNLAKNPNLDIDSLEAIIRGGTNDGGEIFDNFSKNPNFKIFITQLLKTGNSNVYYGINHMLTEGRTELSNEDIDVMLDDSKFKNWLISNLQPSNFANLKTNVRERLVKEYLLQNNKKPYNTEKDVNINTPRIPIHKNPQKTNSFRETEELKQNAEKLYHALLKRQELQYKYDKLHDYYANKEVPEDSKFPVIQFNLIEINQSIAKYIYFIIWDWRRVRLDSRQRRIVEMTQNELILSKLKQAISGRNVEQQRTAIEMGLNTIHSSGSMIEHMGLDKYLLDYLSNMDTTMWDKQIEHMSSSKKDIKISAREL